jgi:uncharacterized protein YkwD
VTQLTEKRTTLVILLLASVFLVTLFSPSLHADAVSEEERLFILTNQERASRGIAMIRRDTLLSQVARNYSREMMEHEFFSHVSEVDGSTLWIRISRSGYYDGYLGRIVIRENIALLSGSANAENAHQGFMNSPGHRENLLAADVNEMGVGITEGYFQSIFASIYVEVFAYHSRDQQELTISASIDPSIATVQRGETATFRIRVESNLPTTATVQVTNISPTLLWSMDRSSGPTPLSSMLTIGTSSAATGTYAFNIVVTAGGLTRTLSSSLIVLQPTQTTTQTTTSTTSTTGTTSPRTTATTLITGTTTSTFSLPQTGTTISTTTPQTTTKSSTSNPSATTTQISLTTATTTTTMVTTSTTVKTFTGSTSHQTTQTTTTHLPTLSTTTNQITETRTGITTIPLPPMRCIIATAAFGSELSPEIQFLRTFRDEIVVSTLGGRMFMTTFNVAYYSFSPPIAEFLSSHPLMAHIVRVLLYPLIAALRLTVIVFNAIYFNNELAILFSGLFASLLIGLIYLAPVVILTGLLRGFRGKTLNSQQTRSNPVL